MGREKIKPNYRRYYMKADSRKGRKPGQSIDNYYEHIACQHRPKCVCLKCHKAFRAHSPERFGDWIVKCPQCGGEIDFKRYNFAPPRKNSKAWKTWGAE